MFTNYQKQARPFMLALFLATLLISCTNNNLQNTATPQSATNQTTPLPTPTITPIPPTPTVTPAWPGLIPLTDLGGATYVGLEGGLYPNGSNDLPTQHASAGAIAASRIQPLDTLGNPAGNGKIILLSVGIANAAEEFCGPTNGNCTIESFVGQASQRPDLNPNLVLLNGAIYGRDTMAWDNRDDENYNFIRDELLLPQGLSEQQVQVIWLKLANGNATRQESLPSNQADAYILLRQLGNVVRSLKERYPNLLQVFLASRTYAGYTPTSANPEPYAYESAFSVKWLIEAQINQMAAGGEAVDEKAGNLNYQRLSPWLAWGPYLWASGSTPRSDGFSWQVGDVVADGVRPAPAGIQKVGQLLLNFFATSPVTEPWFLYHPQTPTPTLPPDLVATPLPGLTPFPTPTPVASRVYTDTTPIPLIDMTSGLTYYGFSGGLYPNNSNDLPAEHAAAGLAHAQAVQPLDTSGNPAPDGKIVLLSIGMSNTAGEFCGSPRGCREWTFVGQAEADPTVNFAGGLALVNGARSGQDAINWVESTDFNYNRIRNEQLGALGLTEAQVQVIWLKVVNGDAASYPSLPDPNSDVYLLMSRMADILRSLKIRYPNLQQVFISSRVYGGYGGEEQKNPEPYAYESGFAVKWLIEAQINQMAQGGNFIDPRLGDLNYNGTVPWIGWAAYLWANGTIPRSDGLIWQAVDFGPDGTHPDKEGQTKVGAMLLEFFKNSPLTQCWFVEGGVCNLP